MTDSDELKKLNDEEAFAANRERVRHKRWRQNATRVLIALVDLILIDAGILVGYFLRFKLEIGVNAGWVPSVPVAPLKPYLQAIMFIDYFILVLFSLFHMYRRDRARWFLDEIRDICKSMTIGFVIVTSLTFFSRTPDFQYSRMVFFYSYILGIIMLTIWRYTVLRMERLYHLKDGNISRVLVIGSGEMAQIVVRRLLDNPGLGYRVVGFLTPDSNNLLDLEGFPYLGSLEEFRDIVIAHQVDEVFISETQLSHFRLLEIVSTCESLGVLIKMVPRVYDLLIDFADMSDLDGLPLVAVREEPMYELNLVFKRIFDIVVSVFLLIILLPVSLIIVLFICLDSKGSILFTQVRAGVSGKPFKMFKFRTMYSDAESRLNGLVDLDNLDEPVFKLKDDPRITRIGKFLRRTSLDEIPQFWNVLKGDMSLVGPRPEETQLVDKYNIWQRRRLKIKPGITGMQQVMCRGTTSLTDRVKFDIYYIRKHSILLDMWIIFRTIPVVISGKGAF
jgi:exopolysaccharide biosynthesis polyprenyl glycosylphosphotransferase